MGPDRPPTSRASPVSITRQLFDPILNTSTVTILANYSSRPSWCRPSNQPWALEAPYLVLSSNRQMR